MTRHLRTLRRQRVRGCRRITVVTVGSAASATVMAAAFGVVLAAGAPSSAAPPEQNSIPHVAAGVNEVVKIKDDDDEIGGVRADDEDGRAIPSAPLRSEATAQPASPPAVTAEKPGPAQQLQPPAQAPRNTPESAHAPSGAS